MCTPYDIMDDARLNEWHERHDTYMESSCPYCQAADDTCREPGHVNGCPGAAGGDHKLDPDIMCLRCGNERPMSEYGARYTCGDCYGGRSDMVLMNDGTVTLPLSNGGTL